MYHTLSSTQHITRFESSRSATLLAKCRQLVGYFNHSSGNTSELKVKHSIVSSSTDDAIFHKLQPDMATRWNSTYMTLARLFEVKDAIIKYHIDLPKNYRGQILSVRLGKNWEINVSLRFTCRCDGIYLERTTCDMFGCSYLRSIFHLIIKS